MSTENLMIQRMFQYNILNPVKDGSGKWIENGAVSSPEFIAYLIGYMRQAGPMLVPRILKQYEILNKPMPSNKELAIFMIHCGIASYLGHRFDSEPSEEDAKMYTDMAEIIEEHYYSVDLEDFRKVTV